MKISTYKGLVQQGQIRLLDDISLPENTSVYVVVPETNAIHPPRIESPRLVNPADASRFAKQVIEIPKTRGRSDLKT